MTEEEIATIRELRAGGMSWKKIGRQMGYSADTVRRNVDDEFRKRTNAMSQRRREFDYRPSVEIKETLRADAAARLALIPPDTRTITGRICGDPLFERSALYAKRMQS